MLAGEDWEQEENNLGLAKRLAWFSASLHAVFSSLRKGNEGKILWSSVWLPVGQEGR